jgi:hypothetical protein
MFFPLRVVKKKVRCVIGRPHYSTVVKTLQLHLFRLQSYHSAVRNSSDIMSVVNLQEGFIAVGYR